MRINIYIPIKLLLVWSVLVMSVWFLFVETCSVFRSPCLNLLCSSSSSSFLSENSGLSVLWPSSSTSSSSLSENSGLSGRSSLVDLFNFFHQRDDDFHKLGIFSWYHLISNMSTQIQKYTVCHYYLLFSALQIRNIKLVCFNKKTTKGNLFFSFIIKVE